MGDVFKQGAKLRQNGVGGFCGKRGGFLYLAMSTIEIKEIFRYGFKE